MLQPRSMRMWYLHNCTATQPRKQKHSNSTFRRLHTFLPVPIWTVQNYIKRQSSNSISQNVTSKKQIIFNQSVGLVFPPNLFVVVSHALSAHNALDIIIDCSKNSNNTRMISCIPFLPSQYMIGSLPHITAIIMLDILPYFALLF